AAHRTAARGCSSWWLPFDSERCWVSRAASLCPCLRSATEHVLAGPRGLGDVDECGAVAAVGVVEGGQQFARAFGVDAVGAHRLCQGWEVRTGQRYTRRGIAAVGHLIADLPVPAVVDDDEGQPHLCLDGGGEFGD